MSNESLNKTKQINFSIVIPVHNEFNMLIQTLPSIFQLKAKEIIFVLDRCTDRTKELIEDFQSRFHFKRVDTRILSIEFKSQWNNHLNFLYDVGIKNARSKINLLSQADVLLDSERINKFMRAHFASSGMVSFAVLSHPHISPLNYLVETMLQVFGSFIGVSRFSGVIAISKNQYSFCPLTSTDSFNFDTQLRINYRQKNYLYQFVRTKNLNLRPWMREKLLDLGESKYKAGKSLWKVLLFSYVRLMPEVFTGYVHAKFAKK